MKDLELICFQMISNVGMARSNFVESIQASKIYDFEKARKLIEEGNEYFKIGHQVHATLLQDMANGKEIHTNLLLIHAEDQLMAAESFRIIAEEMIDVYSNIQKKDK